MAYDILFRKQTSRNWARKAPVSASASASTLDPSLPFTEPEKAMIAKIALCKANAQAGDKKAIKKWNKLAKEIVTKRKKAAKGDLRAARTVSVLKQSGVFAGVKRIAA